MKRLIALMIIFSVISCLTKKENNYQKSDRVVIAGKVLNFNSQSLSVRILVNRIGVASVPLEADLDKEGNFLTTFKTYTPTDVWIRYKSNFLVLIHPGDSLYVEFDGNPKTRADVFKMIKFGGREAKLNRDAAEFQNRYYAREFSDQEKKTKAIKDYNVAEFKSYLDNNKTSLDSVFNQFVLDVKPSEEAKVWAREFLNSTYWGQLAYYPFVHQKYNNLKPDSLHLPDGYFSPILNRSPIDKSMFISGHALSSYLNYYLLASGNTQGQNKQIQQIGSTGPNVKKDAVDSDSLRIYGLINSISDTLLRQMVLTEFFSERIKYSFDVEVFEKYQEVARKYIMEPFLWEPLFELYQTNKKELGGMLSGSQAIDNYMQDSIIGPNKGKVIYVDCWATWCRPCIAEMPNSKKLMEGLNDPNLVFAFLCLHSDKKDWKSTIDKLQIGGLQYFLSKKQSQDFSKFYAINGVPSYMLIDKHGNIVDRGTHLGATVVKGKIEKLLKQ